MHSTVKLIMHFETVKYIFIKANCCEYFSEIDHQSTRKYCNNIHNYSLVKESKIEETDLRLSKKSIDSLCRMIFPLSCVLSLAKPTIDNPLVYVHVHVLVFISTIPLNVAKLQYFTLLPFCQI